MTAARFGFPGLDDAGRERLMGTTFAHFYVLHLRLHLLRDELARPARWLLDRLGRSR